MDIRRKTFVGEATSRLEFLLQEHGFAGPEVEQDGSYPLLMRVRYHRRDMDVEEILILSYGGEEYVTAEIVLTGQVCGAAARTEVGADTARTGFQMRQALDRHVRKLREFFSTQLPASPPGQ